MNEWAKMKGGVEKQKSMQVLVQTLCDGKVGVGAKYHTQNITRKISHAKYHS